MSVQSAKPLMMLLNLGSLVLAAIQGKAYTEIFCREDYYFYIKVPNNGNREIKMYTGGDCNIHMLLFASDRTTMGMVRKNLRSMMMVHGSSLMRRGRW